MFIDIVYSSLFTNFATIIFLIIMGMGFRYTKIISEQNLEFLNSFILKVMLPCFILSSFMRDLTESYLSSGWNIIIWAIVIHFIFYIISNIFYRYFSPKLSKNDQIALQNILPLGNITFYGVAINSMIYGANGIFVANIYAIINRLLLNSISFGSMSGLKLNKNDIIKLFKAPTLQFTLIGVMIFFFQDSTPKITINNIQTSILRIDHTLPFLFNGIQKIGSMLSTFAWLVIGASITKESLTLITKSPYSIIFSIHKTIIMPIIGIIIYIILHNFLGFTIDDQLLPATLMLLVTPVANTLIIFSIKFKRSPDLCISCMIMSTIFSLLLFPLYKILFIFLILKNII